MKNVFFAFIFLCFESANAQYLFTKQWDYRYGGTKDDILSFIQETKDKGTILTGGAYSGISGDKTQDNWDTSYATADVWIVKLDSTGHKEWEKRFGGLLEDGGNNVQQTKDGGYIIGAMSSSDSSGNKTQPSWGGDDYWLIKTDAIGNKLWDKRFGGFGSDLLYSIDQTLDGGYILGGVSESPVSGDKTQSNWGGDNYWVVKADSTGNKVWDKRFGGTDFDFLYSLQQCRDGGYLLGGVSSSDSSGDKTEDNWANTYNFWIVKINALGNKIWDKRFGGLSGERFWALEQTPDDGFILGGSSYSGISGDKTQPNHSNDLDYWVVKIDSVGNKQWDKDYGGTGEDLLRSLFLTKDGGYLVGGVTKSPTSGDKTENNLGLQQPWILKLDSFGNLQWDKTIFLLGVGFISNVIQTSDGCYMVGSSSGQGIGGYRTQPTWGFDDYWIIKFCMDTFTAIDDRHETEDTRQIQVYPNPFSSDLSVALKGENIHEATFTITNTIGQVIYKREENNLSSNYTKMLDLSYMPSGFYFITVTQNGEVFTKKVVKE